MLFLCYPKCSTCRKARAFLDEAGIAYTFRDIQKDNPTAAELDAWQTQSGLPLKRFFNTSGQAYRRLTLKDRLPAMPRTEQLALLATDGLLVKRPLLVANAFVLVGFSLPQWQAALQTG
ncbi:arsenate reductase family protein [Ruminococcaceae bacterium OttesenSCG-928-O06]|nr:arsenate reductase family protein [Ruminococcaceae bacterium OttesenSCG-928-O06]